MKNLVNETLFGMVNDGKLSIERINTLVEVKEFIDRISSKKYLEEEAISDIENKYGTKPSVLTWGDYFQSEIATTLNHLTDEEFYKAAETVKYDMISSYNIFSEQDSSFFEWVDTLDVGNSPEVLSEEELEYMHLKILKIYYVDLGINGHFTEAELAWYNSFKRAAAI